MTDTINYLRRCADNKVLEASLTPEQCRDLLKMFAVTNRSANMETEQKKSVYSANCLISANLRYVPLYLSGDGWSVEFQERPQKNVIVNGRPPTYEELIERLSTGNVSQFVMAKCLFVAAHSAFGIASEAAALRRERDELAERLAEIEPALAQVEQLTDEQRALARLFQLIERHQIGISPPSSPVHRNGGPNAGWGKSGFWGGTAWVHGLDKRPVSYGKSSALEVLEDLAEKLVPAKTCRCGPDGCSDSTSCPKGGAA